MINPATSTKLTHEAIDISVVVPVYNERENLEPLTGEIYSAIEGLGRSYEIIFVDDGSQDGSFDILAALHEQDPRLRVIQFRRNFGQTAAFAAGFDHARGSLVITLDADGQNDPADIPRLLNVIENGEYDVVTGWRVNRREPLLRRFLSWTANLLISRGSQVTVHDRGCSLKVFRNDLAKSLRLYGQMHRFLPEIASSVGARVAEVPVNDRARKFGRSKYGAISRTPRVLLDMITVIFLLGFFSSPMRFFGSAGLVSLLLGFLVSGGLAAAKVYTGIMGGWAAFHAYEIGNRPLLLMAVLMILLGMQFLMMGLLGEMMMRTYYESQNKPPYTIRKSLG
jgi:glycosyltransferase involved in cell wall biosynthesis